MRIALATCRDLPDWEVDDRPFHAALAQRGATLCHPVWDDDSFDYRRVDGCLIRTTWDYMERRDEFVAWASRVAKQTRLFNPAEIVAWNTDKHYLADLAAAGVPTTPTLWLQRGDSPDVVALLAERGWSRAFLKPAIGATARETLRFDVDHSGVDAATRHLARLLPHESMLLQPYLASVEQQGERSILFIDGSFSHAVCKTPVPGDYRVQDDFGASDAVTEPTDEELRIAWAAMAAAERRFTTGAGLLYGRADFLRDDTGHSLLSELELVEPSLFFRHAPAAADRLADALLRRLAADGA